MTFLYLIGMTIIISRENGWLIIDRKEKDMLLHIFFQDGNNLKAIYIFYPDEGIISQRNDMILLKKKKILRGNVINIISEIYTQQKFKEREKK